MAKNKKAGKTNNPVISPDAESVIPSRESLNTSAAIVIITTIENWNKELSSGNREYLLYDEDFEELWSSENLGGRRIRKFDLKEIASELQSIGKVRKDNF